MNDGPHSDDSWVAQPSAACSHGHGPGISPRPRLFAAHDLETLELQVASCDQRRGRKDLTESVWTYNFVDTHKIDVQVELCYIDIVIFYCILVIIYQGSTSTCQNAVPHRNTASAAVDTLEDPPRQMILE